MKDVNKPFDKEVLNLARKIARCCTVDCWNPSDGHFYGNGKDWLTGVSGDGETAVKCRKSVREGIAGAIAMEIEKLLESRQ